jgi:CHAT domain-containing protein
VKYRRFPFSVVVAIAALLTTGSFSPGRNASDRVSPVRSESPELHDLRHQGNAFFLAGDYLRAGAVYDRGYREAIAKDDRVSALRFLNNIGSAHFLLFQYREAVSAYLKAKDLAQQENDQDSLAAVYSNLSSLYFVNGEMSSASEAASEGLKLPRKAGSKFRSKLLIQTALISLQQKDSQKGLALLKEAAAVSQASGDTASEAQALSELGRALLSSGNLASADQALLEAARLREKTGGDTLHYVYESLGDLRMRQGDTNSAIAFYDRAIASATPFGPSAYWTALYLHGRALLAEGRLNEAWHDFEAALKAVRQSRVEILPADAFRTSSEVRLHEVYSSFIETGRRLYMQTGERRYAEQTFAVAEESRAASLRALWAGPDLTARLHPEYFQTVLELQKAEVAQLKESPGADEAARRAKVRLTELELKSGLDLPPVSDDAALDRLQSLTRARAALAPDEVYIGFRVDPAGSCVWAFTRDDFEMRTFPAQYPWDKVVADFRKAVSADALANSETGLQLYEFLFGKLRRGFLDKPVWIIAPDGPLYDLPFAALPVPVSNRFPGLNPPGRIHYLIEEHAVGIVPGIMALMRKPAPVTSGAFVAIGDPIYNRVDDRLRDATLHRIKHDDRGSVSLVSTLRLPLPSSPSSPPARALLPPQTMELNRLAGTGREVEACATQWRSHGSRAELLEGTDANTAALTAAIGQSPRVLHIAAHMLFPDHDSGPPILALSLLPENQVQLLSATEISNLRSTMGLVVLDGCGSGRGEILPGTGVMGMTRAWLAAGARAVIATRWPVSDGEAGAFFHSFYEFYYQAPPGSRGAMAKILQRTQVEQLRSGGTHASPAYWSAYFSVERN